MKEYKSEENGIRIEYEDDRRTDYPIGVRLYKGGEIAFMSLTCAICLERLLKKAIKEATKSCES
jgi:hypothetical protein